MSIIRNLGLLNAKERFYLFMAATDARMTSDESGFLLSSRFRSAIKERTGWIIPDNHFAAIDYHLEWLYAAVLLEDIGEDIHKADNLRERYPIKEIVRGNQEDIDLLIAYEDGEVTRMVLVEAKGFTAWSNEQLMSKLERLNGIFSEGRGAEVEVLLILMSPKEPKKLEGISVSGSWLKKDKDDKPYWMPLVVPSEMGKVTRENKNSGTWVIEKR